MSRPLALPWHQLPAGAGRLDVPDGPSGIVIGYEVSGTPAAVRLFRARPTSVAVLGCEPVGRRFVQLAIMAGADVTVHTVRPAHWAAQGVAEGVAQGVAQGAVLPQTDGPRGTLTLQPSDAPTPPPGTPHRPSLVVDEVAPGAPAPHRECGRWQATVALYARPSANLVPSLRGCDLVVTERVPREMVGQLRAVTDLSERDARWLPEVPDQIVALISRGTLRCVRLA